MDVVYFQSDKVSQRELKYSLRSMAANVPHERVFFVGFAPPWVTDVTLIEAKFPVKKFHSLHAKTMLLANTRLDIEEMTMFDDDMYVLKPQTNPIPWLTVGEMKPFDRGKPLWETNSNSWIQMQWNSVQFLKSQGIEYIHDMSIHTPHVYNKDTLMKLAEVAPRDHPIMWRIVYPNMYVDDIQPLEADVKSYSIDQLKKVLAHDSGFLSSHNGSIHTMEDYLDGLFPEKCVYEV